VLVPRLRPTRLLALGGLALVAFFYWKPLHSYLHTKRELQARHSQVHALLVEKAKLEKQIAQADSGPQLIREARRLGLVKPGERLFIVRGINAWRHKQR
jgi:cell division protein FtsB